VYYNRNNYLNYFQKINWITKW